MNIGRYLDRAANRSPNAPAVKIGETDLFSYHEFASRVASLAGFLANLGIAPGDRVAMFMNNSFEFLEILQAIFRCGAAAVPVNAKLHASELAAILETAEPKLLFVDAKTAEVAAIASGALERPPATIDVTSKCYARALVSPAKSLVERTGDDLAWLFFTSGTTGRSKGAMLTHRNLTLMGLSYLLEVNAVASTDSLLHAAPMSHGSGMYILPHIMRDAAQIVCEQPSFNGPEIVAICSQSQGVSMFAAPTMLHRLVRLASNATTDIDALRRGLRQITYGGGPMLLSGARSASAVFGSRLAQIYGQGECPMTISRLQSLAFGTAETADSDQLLSSVGQPFDLVEVAIDQATEPFQTGEILARSDIVMAGYWQQPEATAETIVDGWLRTGDVGYFDEAGNLHLADRSKDVIISGGTNIYSREVEDVLARHPSVEEIAVVGKPSEEWGEEVVAFIACADGEEMDERELDRFCLTHMARFKRPKAYYSIREMPKNAYGKIEKSTLRKFLTSA